MAKLYGILKNDGTLHQDWSGCPWTAKDYGGAKSVARTANGKAVRVEIVICTPKRRASSALYNGKKMAISKWNANLAKEFTKNMEAESKKLTPKKVGPKARKLVKTGPAKKVALDSYTRGKSLVDEFSRKGYATIKPVGRGRPKGARVSPRKVKKSKIFEGF